MSGFFLDLKSENKIHCQRVIFVVLDKTTKFLENKTKNKKQKAKNKIIKNWFMFNLSIICVDVEI